LPSSGALAVWVAGFEGWFERVVRRFETFAAVVAGCRRGTGWFLGASICTGGSVEGLCCA